MKFTLSWLKDHLKTNAELDKILNTLTNIGLEVEKIELIIKINIIYIFINCKPF